MDDLSDDVLLHGIDDSFLDKSALNVEKEIKKYELTQRFSE